ncbi:RUS3 [Symbiodinium necroappetens]|uniref:RUS3 protein n=1 Tax=Symbiodinium necroappetens TaxID=1628268 RepID=A0A813C2D4_9DINO|nr:RUS3 [Symbiodinium necroappetens]
MGSNTPLVLYGGPLGALLRETEGSRCVFRPEGFSEEAEAAPWVLDSQRVACFPPAIPGLPGGRKVGVTLRIHGMALPSEATFLLFPERRLTAAPLQGCQMPSNGLGVDDRNERAWSVFHANHQGAQVKLWVTPTAYDPQGVLMTLNSFYGHEKAAVLPVRFSTYFIDPTEGAAEAWGLLVRGAASVEVSPSMLLATPKVTSVYPRMVPWSISPSELLALATRSEDPSLLIVGLGFVNTNLLRCRLVDTALLACDSQRSAPDCEIKLKDTQWHQQVRCGLPPFELPGSSNVKIEVSNDGTEWSTESFEVYIVSALELRKGHARGQRKRRSLVKADGNGALFLHPVSKTKGSALTTILANHELGCHRVARFIKKVFLPVDYPSSVTKNYVHFIWFTAGQLLFCHMSKVIATQAMLLAVGVGGREMVPMAAVTAWVLKDGIGHLLAILVGTFINKRFDSDPKRFRFQAIALAKTADLICILTLQWPKYFFALSALGGALGRLSMNTGQASRPRVLETFARANNLGDIMRCNTAQMTASELLGTGLGACLGRFLGAEVHLMICASTILALASLACCYQATCQVQMKSLNRQRAELVLEPAVHHICASLSIPNHNGASGSDGMDPQSPNKSPAAKAVLVPSVEEIRDREAFVRPYRSAGCTRLDVNPMLEASCQLLTPLDSAARHILGYSRRRLALWYHMEATAPDVLKGFLQSQLLRKLADQDGGDGDLAKLSLLAADLAELWWPLVHAALLAAGWQTELVFLDAKEKRICIQDSAPSQVIC